MKSAIMMMAAMAAGAAFAAEPAPKVTVTVDMKGEVGPIRLMNAVNNGPAVAPVRGDQKRGNFEEYKAARIPFARTHDAINCVSGGAHCCDIDAIFPDFDADENDPKNYDFVFTDHYLDNIRRAGTEVFFRLGQTRWCAQVRNPTSDLARRLNTDRRSTGFCRRRTMRSGRGSASM